MKNFGKIKNTVNTIVAEGLSQKDQDKKTLFKKYVRAINENKILKNQFKVYTAIESMVEENEFKATEKIKAHINALKDFDINAIEEANLALAGALGLDISEEPYEGEELHENIANLIFASNDIDVYVDSLSEAVEYVKNNEVIEESDEPVLPNSVLSSVTVDKFNEKYSDISEDEKKVLKAIIAADDQGRQDIFSETARHCIDIVDGRLSEASIEDKESLLKIKDKILRMEYVQESFVADISKLIELKVNLEGAS